MNWLAPIGFLGLLGLVGLILIYVIHPNYQNKRISSTYVWRLSLKYRKRKKQSSKIRDLLVFLCQALILAILGTLLAGPVIEAFQNKDENETVIIIDASAGMRIKDEEKTRFERAVSEARKKAESTFEKGSRVTVIVADEEPEFLFTRVGRDGKKAALEAIDALYASAEENCTFSTGDVGSALSLAESVVESNSSASVYLYTGTQYTYNNGVKVVSVASDTEWNAAILDCRAELDNDNHYAVTVNVACYGKTDFITVTCKFHGVNGDPYRTVTLEKGEFFDPTDAEKEIVFNSDDMTDGVVYSYDYVETYVSVRDSLADDNAYFLYGGKKPVVKIQYASSSPNNFFESALRSLRQKNRETWDVQITLLKESEAFATEGFDIYIFEHKMPETLPTDGVVLLVDPRTAPLGSNLQIGSSYSVDSSSVLSSGISHELTKHTYPEHITIAKYNDVVLSEGYEELMFYNGRPVMLYGEVEQTKVLVWAFDLNYSNLIALPDFSILVYNMFNHFVCKAFEGNTFEVGETVAFDTQGDALKITGAKGEYVFENGKGEFIPERPGTYTVTQGADGGAGHSEENFFVHIPTAESNTAKTVDVLPFTQADDTGVLEYEDLILYFSIALVVLICVEWVLEIKKNY